MECKSSLSFGSRMDLSELIDTLWNVNTDITISNSVANRINRYIMECKYSFSAMHPFFWYRINRYIMECKCDVLMQVTHSFQN